MADGMQKNTPGTTAPRSDRFGNAIDPVVGYAAAVFSVPRRRRR